MRGAWALAAILAAWPTSGEQVPLALDNERNGSVITHMFPYCGGNRVGGFKPISVPPDRCLSTHGLSFRILQPAICPNGTRAKLARFPDSKCSKGEITALNGLTDIADSDISTSRGRACKETSEALKMPDGSWAKQGGMVFWCDPSQRKQPEQPDTTKPEEPEVPKPQARKASVSHNSCWGKGRPTAPVFPKISHDTCVNLDKGKQLKIYSLAVCPDGSESRFTTFQGRNCRGAPADAEPEKDVLNRCMSLSEDDELDMSYAFLCDGLKEVKMTGETSGEPKEQGSILGLVLILCLIGATFLLIGVLTCLKWASLLHRILDIFRKQDGAIRL